MHRCHASTQKIKSKNLVMTQATALSSLEKFPGNLVVETYAKKKKIKSIMILINFT